MKWGGMTVKKEKKKLLPNFLVKIYLKRNRLLNTYHNQIISRLLGGTYFSPDFHCRRYIVLSLSIFLVDFLKASKRWSYNQNDTRLSFHHSKVCSGHFSFSSRKIFQMTILPFWPPLAVVHTWSAHNYWCFSA